MVTWKKKVWWTGSTQLFQIFSTWPETRLTALAAWTLGFWAYSTHFTHYKAPCSVFHQRAWKPRSYFWSWLLHTYKASVCERARGGALTSSQGTWQVLLVFNLFLRSGLGSGKGAQLVTWGLEFLPRICVKQGTSVWVGWGGHRWVPGAHWLAAELLSQRVRWRMTGEDNGWPWACAPTCTHPQGLVQPRLDSDLKSVSSWG